MTQENPITSAELYAIDSNPKFLGQTPIDIGGAVIMKWKTIRGIRFTKSQVY
ncbi:MAG: hypothetical protein HRT87_07915 [Legionellales bacterium]|nr:hypothetical protein [Legionellales bacterium]